METKALMFDLDGTLCESKNTLSEDMVTMLYELLEKRPVAIATGGTIEQIQKQVVDVLPEGTNKENLFLYPTSGAKLVSYVDNKWETIYEYRIQDSDWEVIQEKMPSVLRELEIDIETLYGEQLEHRGTQISWSAHGQQAPYDIKKHFDPDHTKRRKIIQKLEPYVPHLEIRSGGVSTIDISQPGMDKKKAIGDFLERLGIKKDELIFIGDAIFPGGNDYAAAEMSIPYIQVDNYKSTTSLCDKFR